MSRRHAARASLLAILVAATGIEAADAPRGAHGRWHFEYAGVPALSLSVIFDRTPERDEIRLLVQTPAGRYRLVSTQDPSGSDSFESVEDAATGETFSRRLYLTRYQGLPECAGIGKDHPDACVIFEGKSGRFATALSAFAGPGAGSLRTKVAALATESLRSRIASLADVFPLTAEFDSYGEDFLGLVWPETFVKRKKAPAIGKRSAGCVFDASFGFPCSEIEITRETKRFGPPASRAPSAP